MNFTQNSAVTATSQCTSNSILNNFFNTTELQQFAQNTDNHFKSQQKGIGSLFGWIIAIVVGIVVIAIIFGIIFLFSGSGGKKEEPGEGGLIRMEELEGLERREGGLGLEGREEGLGLEGREGGEEGLFRELEKGGEEGLEGIE